MGSSHATRGFQRSAPLHCGCRAPARATLSGCCLMLDVRLDRLTAIFSFWFATPLSPLRTGFWFGCGSHCRSGFAATLRGFTSRLLIGYSLYNHLRHMHTWHRFYLHLCTARSAPLPRLYVPHCATTTSCLYGYTVLVTAVRTPASPPITQHHHLLRFLAAHNAPAFAWFCCWMPVHYSVAA